MIDLHLHTTASDGGLSPGELVEHAAAAGLHVMAVTDHDTTAAVPDVQALARTHGIDAISGIEITAIDAGRDVHVLGYFIDPAHHGLTAFLQRQREIRVARVEAIGRRLASLGVPIDLEGLLASARQQSGRSIGRPQVARAMVEAGHVASSREAFDRWLGQGLPGFVPRQGAGSEQVIAVIHDAGGLASIAHPGKSIADGRIASLRDQGLDALEAFHPDHDAARVVHYVALASTLGLLMTGGSDFHGDPSHGLPPGSVTLPAHEWQRLSASRYRHA
ncbi:MAG TPA: PHP domain-containing protein [Vicinamibacterales bacterium]